MDEPVFAVEARPAVNSEAGDLIVVEPNSKLDHPTLKLEPGLAAEPDAKAEELPSERADILVQTLRGIRSNATGSAQNTKTIQCLMANFIVITTATDETKSVEQAKQVQMASLQVERACHAIVSTVDKIMGSTGPASDVCTQLARLSELCVGARSRADVVESALEKMSERDLRLQVLQDKVWDVQIGLEKVTGKLGQLGEYTQ